MTNQKRLAELMLGLDKCTGCSACTTACPVAAVSRRFTGPKLNGPVMSRLRQLSPDDDKSVDLCSNCKNCDIACPMGVPISTLNMLAKDEYYKHHRHQQIDEMLAHNEKMGRLLTSLPMAGSLANCAAAMGKSLGFLRHLGFADDVKMPPFANTSFYKRFKRFKQHTGRHKVVFFAGCFINYNQPEVGMDLVKIYQHNDIEVAVDKDFVCCGSPMAADGYLAEAKLQAQKNVQLLNKWAKAGYDIVTACTSCGLMLKQEYQELFDLQEEPLYAEHMYDSMEYLSLLHDYGELKLDFKQHDVKYIYHQPCHLKVQAIGAPSLQVLPLVPGLGIKDADAGCCGISGSYGFKKERRDISLKIGAKLFDVVKRSKAQQAVSECGPCRLQIESGTGIAAVHPLSILRHAYDL